ncbi:site-2 protease family protein [Anaerobacillus sp. CMMVII]|uniref:site-2 protease family protein n=1 Tax=Anaerobacillus sp. CMMVII TaxID=2755588 RepID=UPI0021B6F866|nr:site-2 protease family protein [Anaerobacillus sp. CMMVII]MCT8137195.1 site-2 protease family protein [Anaerobacillus sp. CMMVII]
MENTLILFGIALLVSVFIHEFGHFAAFRLFGGRVEELALGFGPTLFKKGIGQSKFSIRLFPLGGYVQPNESDFNRYNYYQKLIFFSAGIFMNFVLYNVSFGFASMSNGKSFINGLVLATDGLIYIVANIGEVFRSLRIDLLFGSQGSVESQMQIVQELGNNVDFWMMVAVINITLIILNSLPIPSLDGGRIVVTTIEHVLLKIGVAKEKIERVTNPIYYFSWILLMGIIALQILSANTFQFIEDVKALRVAYGMNNLEVFLWTSLCVVFFINIYIFISNRLDKIRRA